MFAPEAAGSLRIRFRTRQVAFNQNLVEQAGSLLVPLNGT